VIEDVGVVVPGLRTVLTVTVKFVLGLSPVLRVILIWFEFMTVHMELNPFSEHPELLAMATAVGKVMIMNDDGISWLMVINQSVYVERELMLVIEIEILDWMMVDGVDTMLTEPESI
jgi:hypothetical protein